MQFDWVQIDKTSGLQGTTTLKVSAIKINYSSELRCKRFMLIPPTGGPIETIDIFQGKGIGVVVPDSVETRLVLCSANSRWQTGKDEALSPIFEIDDRVNINFSMYIDIFTTLHSSGNMRVDLIDPEGHLVDMLCEYSVENGNTIYKYEEVSYTMKRSGKFRIRVSAYAYVSQISTSVQAEIKASQTAYYFTPPN